MIGIAPTQNRISCKADSESKIKYLITYLTVKRARDRKNATNKFLSILLIILKAPTLFDN